MPGEQQRSPAFGTDYFPTSIGCGCAWQPVRRRGPRGAALVYRQLTWSTKLQANGAKAHIGITCQSWKDLNKHVNRASHHDWCLQVDELPCQDEASRRSTLADLTAAPPSQDLWQVGGSTNFTIAAARLGLNVCCCGNVGDDAFGMYLLACLEVRSALGVCECPQHMALCPLTLACPPGAERSLRHLRNACAMRLVEYNCTLYLHHLQRIHRLIRACVLRLHD